MFFNETGFCIQFLIDFEMLKKKFKLFPEFELNDEFYVGDIIYYAIKSQTKRDK